MRKVKQIKSHTEYNFLKKIKWVYTYIMFNTNRAYFSKCGCFLF